MIRTTISIDTHLAKKFMHVCTGNLHLKRKIIIKASHIAMKKHRRLKGKHAVCYQARTNNFTRVHISLPEDIYEILTDLRSFGKFSVSLMISYALTLILNVSAKSEIKVDNYPQLHYSIEFESLEDKDYCIISWKKCT